MENKNILPGNVHISGVVVLAIIVVIIFYARRMLTGNYAFTTSDIGQGQGVIPAAGYGNPNRFDEEANQHFHQFPLTSEPAYHQPAVIQQGRRRPFYSFIDQYSHSEEPAFLERRSYP